MSTIRCRYDIHKEVEIRAEQINVIACKRMVSDLLRDLLVKGSTGIGTREVKAA